MMCFENKLRDLYDSFYPKDRRLVSSLSSNFEKFKDDHINDSDLFFNCIMVPVRVTSG